MKTEEQIMKEIEDKAKERKKAKQKKFDTFLATWLFLIAIANGMGALIVSGAISMTTGKLAQIASEYLAMSGLFLIVICYPRYLEYLSKLTN
jgi:hypothetical protein